jgi:pyruvate kinase
MPRQRERNSRELPIPIDNFELRSRVILPEIPPNARLAVEGVEFWVSLGPGFTRKQLITLLTKPYLVAARINITKFPHMEALVSLVKAIREIRSDLAVCIDTGGPKVRVARLKELSGSDYLDISRGDRVCVVYFEDYKKAPNGCKVLPVDSQLLAEMEPPLPYLFVSDGWQQLQIQNINDGIIFCEALHDALIYDRRGVAIPGVLDRLDPLTTDDKSRLTEIAQLGATIDYIGLSFANKAEDVNSFRSYLNSISLHGKIIAKLETASGIAEAEAIAATTDAVMLARGDLAVELAPHASDMIAVEDHIRTICYRQQTLCVIATRVADSLEEGRSTLDEYEVYRLQHELEIGAPVTLMLANETIVGERAATNYDIVIDTVARLQYLRRSSHAARSISGA